MLSCLESLFQYGLISNVLFYHHSSSSVSTSSLFQYGLISNEKKAQTNIKDLKKSLFQYGLISNVAEDMLLQEEAVMSLFQYGLISNNKTYKKHTKHTKSLYSNMV